MNNEYMKKVNIVIPAKNEADNLRVLLPKLINMVENKNIIVVDDGSTDETRSVCENFNIDLVIHPYSKGNGAAIKSGAKRASQNTIIFMDADCQHDPEDIKKLHVKLCSGYDMVVGARSLNSQANILRLVGNQIYNHLATFVVGHRVVDLTSGFRAVNREKFLEFYHLYPNGFSYPTTSTMAFFRSGHSVSYVPIVAKKRTGKSHINLIKDGIRFILIILRVGTFYSPLKIFFPIAMANFILGLSYYTYTYFTDGRFTNMGVLLFVSALIIFLIGLVSEQITSLLYKT